MNKLNVLKLFQLTCLLQCVFIKSVFCMEVGVNNGTGVKLMNQLEEKLEKSVSDYAVYFTKSLERFNDEQLGDTYLGRLIHYSDLKPNIEGESSRRRAMHKLTSSMLPLVFHVGATSTWMLLTAVMTVKSVLIGLVLLIFKIAVSSAKVSSFFTTLKHKASSPHHHHDWSYSAHDHGNERSLSLLESAHHSHDTDWHLKKEVQHEVHWPSGKPTGTYKTIADSYHPSGELDPYGGHEYADDEQKSDPDPLYSESNQKSIATSHIQNLINKLEIKMPNKTSGRNTRSGNAEQLYEKDLAKISGSGTKAKAKCDKNSKECKWYDTPVALEKQ